MEPIAAISTGSSATAIGIVRVSGDGCYAVCDQVFRPKNQKNFSAQEHHKMVFGEMLDTAGDPIDQGLAVRFPAQHSYTGEDSVEFHCHGSPVVLQELLTALFAAGARQAKAGEFTKRAFLNGKMDLTQAEAVIDLIHAETSSAARNAVAQLEGGLQRKLTPVQDALIDMTSRFYAVVDYPDEDIEDIQPDQISAFLSAAEQTLSALLSTAQRGKVLKNGVRCAIVGRPNVGKSSLLNALAGYERAIVTDVAGTTRDTVEESVLCGGVLLRLIDTAGMHDTLDIVEQKGVERSRKALEQADLVFAVVDGSQPLTEEDYSVLYAAAKCPKWVLIWGKKDLGGQPMDFPLPLSTEYHHPDATVHLSAQTGEGIDQLEQAVSRLFPVGVEDCGSLLTDLRQEEAVSRALNAVRRAKDALESGLTPDAILTDAEYALDAIGELTGRTAKEEIVSAIFSRFCVGK